MLEERFKESGKSLRKRVYEKDGKLAGCFENPLRPVMVNHGGSCVFVSGLFSSLV